MKDKESMLTLVKKIDSANGYVFGGKHEEGNLSEMLSHAAGADFEYFKYPFRKLCSFAYRNGCHNTVQINYMQPLHIVTNMLLSGMGFSKQ